MTGMDSLTDVSGIRVGHAVVPGGGSGCTVILGPFLARVEVRGSATGTRELETLRVEHLVPRADAILLSGGSAFGLAAADGVMAWLAEQGVGYETGAGPVPIVPAAILFDLAEGQDIPGPEEGWTACEAAGTGSVPNGPLGAGAGARVGKLLGPERSSPGGVGSASASVGGWTVGALAAVNALGDVVDRNGRIVAGARTPDGDGFADACVVVLRAGRVGEARSGEGGQDGGVRRGERNGVVGPRAGENTTLAVVATDAPLAGRDLTRMLRVAGTALPRRITPVHTPFDGDVVFGVTTAGMAEGGGGRGSGDGEQGAVGTDGGAGSSGWPASLSSVEVLTLGLAARECLETAILRAVGHGGPDGSAGDEGQGGGGESGDGGP
jgi:L-aminopeptidase/D-esterase-like protein